jgi:DNA-binding GntR family transcriptional regulator
MARARGASGERGGEERDEAPAAEASRDYSAVYSTIKRLIVEGALPSGSAVSQLELTRRLGVSRTPIREALRRLQAEGLLDAERNRRMRVTSISPDELDAIYSTRIFLESMAVELSVPRMTDDDLEDLQAASCAIDWTCVISDPQRHDRHLANFKLKAMKYAGEGVRRAVLQQFDGCERVRKMYQVSAANAGFARDEHGALLQAYMRRSKDEAVFVASRHLGRTALAVIGFVAPDYEPRAIRHALAKMGPPAYGSATSVLSVVGDGPVPRQKGATLARKGVNGK